MSRLIPVCEPMLDGNEIKYVNEALSDGWISSAGKFVSDFEQSFASYSGSKFGIATTNGTTALHLALVSLGIGEGDEVIIPSFTMVASAFAVAYTGATPVFCDVDRQTWNMTIENVQPLINSKTKAIMPVHIFGTPCFLDEISELCKEFELLLVQDSAEAHGAQINGESISSFGDASCYSFFSNKNLTTGEGGMVLTNNEDTASKLRYFKNLCFDINGNRNYIHNDIGFNYRMSNLHAAIGLAQVEKADFYFKRRNGNAQMYRELLQDLDGIVFQKIHSHLESAHWMNAIVLSKSLGKSRDSLSEFLKENGIETRNLFQGMHRQPSLEKFRTPGYAYPNSDWLSDSGLYLPSSSNLTSETIEFVSRKVRDFIER